MHAQRRSSTGSLAPAFRIGALSLVVVALVVVTPTLPAHARHHRSRPTPEAGTFDYYVMSLSWSPQHCATGTSSRTDDRQCTSTRKYGFVLHGLWPQYEAGYPQSCATAAHLTGPLVESLLDIMPSQALVYHEWSTHGACSGLSPGVYFAQARSAFTSVQIPVRYADPATALQTNASEISRAFREANPALTTDDLAVVCRGNFLQEVRICLDKDLHPRACGHDVHDTCRGPITIRPVK